MSTRSEILSTLSRSELARTLAVLLVDDMRAEAADIGAELSDYDLDSFADAIDSVSHDIAREIESQLGN